MDEAAEMIACFGRAVTVRRPARGAYVEGRWVQPDAHTDIKIIASVQPIDGRTLERLPEAQRTREVRKIYASKVLFNRVEALGRKADIIVMDGECWEVSTVELWGPMLDHSKCLIMKMSTNEGVDR